jgi:hypothetical protein
MRSAALVMLVGVALAAMGTEAAGQVTSRAVWLDPNPIGLTQGDSARVTLINLTESLGRLDWRSIRDPRPSLRAVRRLWS